MLDKRVGVHYEIPPQPLSEDDTKYVDAGAVRIGVEYREVDDAALRDLYKDTEFESIYAAMNSGPQHLVGVSLHVCDADDGREYLRFDCFDGEPHYHYIYPRVPGQPVDNHVVWFDAVAHGPILPWALGQIRSRLPEMLAQAGAGHLAPRVDSERLEKAAQEIEAIAADAIAAQRRTLA